MRTSNRPNVEQRARDRIEDLGLDAHMEDLQSPASHAAKRPAEAVEDWVVCPERAAESTQRARHKHWEPVKIRRGKRAKWVGVGELPKGADRRLQFWCVVGFDGSIYARADNMAELLPWLQVTLAEVAQELLS